MLMNCVPCMVRHRRILAQDNSMSRYFLFRHSYGTAFHCVGGHTATDTGRTFLAMGSLSDGTLCSYCNVHEAYYIPDGCCGPLCGHCMDLGIQHGYDHVFILRLERWIRAKFWRLSPRVPRRPVTLAESVIHHPLVALHISQFLVEMTDGSETWRMGDADASAPSGIEFDDTDQLPR